MMDKYFSKTDHHADIPMGLCQETFDSSPDIFTAAVVGNAGCNPLVESAHVKPRYIVESAHQTGND